MHEYEADEVWKYLLSELCVKDNRKFNPIKNGVYILAGVNYLESATADGPGSPRGHM